MHIRAGYAVIKVYISKGQNCAGKPVCAQADFIGTLQSSDLRQIWHALRSPTHVLTNHCYLISKGGAINTVILLTSTLRAWHLLSLRFTYS